MHSKNAPKQAEKTAHGRTMFLPFRQTTVFNVMKRFRILLLDICLLMF